MVTGLRAPSILRARDLEDRVTTADSNGASTHADRSLRERLLLGALVIAAASYLLPLRRFGLVINDEVHHCYLLSPPSRRQG